MAKNQKTKDPAAAIAAVATMIPDPVSESEPLIPQTNHEEIARLAFEYWQARGCPVGSPEEDWFRAEREWRAQVGKAAA
jgi:hypothetical protein